MKKTRRIVSSILAAGMLLTLASCSSSSGGSSTPANSTTPASSSEPSASGPAEPYELMLGSSNTSGAYYQWSVALAEIINKYANNVTANAVVTTGAPESVAFMKAGELDTGGGSGSTCYAMAKEANEEAGEDSICIFLSAFPTYLQLMTTSDFEGDTIRDLEGKRFNICTADNSTNVMMRGYFAAMGLDIEDFLDVVEISMTEGTEALKEGTVDAICNASGLGNATALELAASRKGMKLLSLTDEDAEAICATSAITRVRTIPAGTYNGVDYDVQTVGDCAPMLINASVPEDVVYEAVKTLCEHNDEWASSVGNAAYSTAENTVADWNGVLPIHPGCVKYFTELGLM